MNYQYPEFKNPIQTTWKVCPDCEISLKDIDKINNDNHKEKKTKEKREVIFPLIGIIFQIIFIICMCIEGAQLVGIFCMLTALILHLIGAFYSKEE